MKLDASNYPHDVVSIFLPRGLDLSSFVEGGGPHPLYDLYAVSNHFGGMGGGHCKSDNSGGIWTLCAPGPHVEVIWSTSKLKNVSIEK